MPCLRQPCPDHTVCPPDPAPTPLPCGLCSAVDPATELCLHHARGAALGLLIAGMRFENVMAQMRKDGQGLSHDQQMTIRRGMGLP